MIRFPQTCCHRGTAALCVRLLAIAMMSLASIAAAEAAPQKTNYSTIDLISEHASLPAAGGTVTLGFYIKTDPKWHAYWKNPGDAGKEPTIKWSLPNGFEAGEFSFPTPHVLPFGEMNTYAYEEAILLLSEVTVPSGLELGRNIALGGKASWVVCDDEFCVPERADISINLTVGNGDFNDANVKALADARDKLPRGVKWPAQFEIVNGMVNFQIAAEGVPDTLNDAYLFIATKKLVDYGTQSLGYTRNGLAFSMDASKRADSVDGTSAVLRYTDEDGEAHSVAFNIDKADGSLAVAAAAQSGRTFSLLNPQSIVAAMIAAFIGGIILNLMPCVFPILSMKALSLVKLGATNQKAARESGAIYTVGILIAFSVIAGILLALRSAGEAVGWGFQMQNPLIVVGLGLLMVAVGMNLLGAFEIGTRVMGVGQGLAEGGERREAFFTGLLAVVVATPCMAPFMAAALGYAITQPVVTSIVVFLALGFGLAFPYLILSFVPALGRHMPKPGAWMETFKQVLAFPLFITALWLFWIVGQQLGATSMFVALLAAMAAAFALWAYGKGNFGRRKTIWYPTALTGLAACVFAVMQVEASKEVPRMPGDESAGTLGGLQLEHFDPKRVEGYIAAGQPTFVYFTADWCISCKANERVALATEEVAEAFTSRGIKVVEGDWTTEDPAITRWLEMYGRAGVPLYLYFPKGSTQETVTILPQILTAGIVVDAIDEADASAETTPAAATTTNDAADSADEKPYVIPNVLAWMPDSNSGFTWLIEGTVL